MKKLKRERPIIAGYDQVKINDRCFVDFFLDQYGNVLTAGAFETKDDADTASDMIFTIATVTKTSNRSMQDILDVFENYEGQG